MLDAELHAAEEPPVPQEFFSGAEMALPGDEYNRDASDPPRRTRRGAFLPRALAAVVGLALLGAAAGVSHAPETPDGVPADASPSAAAVQPADPIPPPAEAPSITLAQAIERCPDWRDADRDVWLHFEGDEGWFYDGSFFHRFVWRADGDAAGHTAMSFNDIGAKYSVRGSATQTAEHALTLVRTGGELRLKTPSGMGEGNIGSSYEYSDPALTEQLFSPAEIPDEYLSAAETFVGKSAAQLLESVGRFTVSEKAAADFAGFDMGVHAGMTGLLFGPDGQGGLSFDDGTFTEIAWSTDGDRSVAARISFENVTFANGMSISSSASTAELTLTAEGPRLWMYSSLDNNETCFAPASEP